MSDPEQLPADIETLLRRGDKLEAIRALCERSDCSLSHSKTRVDDWLLRHTGRDAAGLPSLPEDIKQMLHAGQRVTALRAVRMRFGLGLGAAKDALEAYENQHPELADQRRAQNRRAVRRIRACALALAGLLIAAIALSAA